MTADEDRIDDAVPVPLHLTLHDGFRTWKTFDWAVLGRLHAKSFIENPVDETKSVDLLAEGLRESKRRFGTHSAKS